MSRFNWACPTCGAATHSKEALVRSSEKSCSCDSALWVASDMPPCVGKLQEEIASLKSERATDAILKNSADKLAEAMMSEIEKLDKRIAALEKVAEAAAKIWNPQSWLPVINFDELGEALREAGYLKEEG